MQILREKANSRSGELSPRPHSVFQDNPERGRGGGTGSRGKGAKLVPLLCPFRFGKGGGFIAQLDLLQPPGGKGPHSPSLTPAGTDQSTSGSKRVGRHQIQNSVSGDLDPLDPQHALKTQLKAPSSWGVWPQFLTSGYRYQF